MTVALSMKSGPMEGSQLGFCNDACLNNYKTQGKEKLTGPVEEGRPLLHVPACQHCCACGTRLRTANAVCVLHSPEAGCPPYLLASDGRLARQVARLGVQSPVAWAAAQRSAAKGKLKAPGLAVVAFAAENTVRE
jgi:hypothetical protein